MTDDDLSMSFGLSGRLGGLETLSQRQFRSVVPHLEEWGYSLVCMNEEHFGPVEDDRFRCAPLMLASMIAMLSTRLRIGFSALLVPLHHPLRLAEDIASLDQISGGRIDFGISRGHAGPYFDAFGVPPDSRTEEFREALATIRRWWAGEEFAFGERSVQLSPPPVQQPGPPIYVAAYSNESVTWAAEQGFHLIQHGIQSVDNLRRCLGVFGDAGGDVGAVPVGRFIYVGENDDHAREVGMPIIERLTTRLRGFRTERFALIHDEDDLDPARFYDTLAIIGGPETVAQRLAELRDDLGVRRINLLSSLFGNLPPDELTAGLERFGRQVIPALSQPAQRPNP